MIFDICRKAICFAGPRELSVLLAGKEHLGKHVGDIYLRFGEVLGVYEGINLVFYVSLRVCRFVIIYIQ